MFERPVVFNLRLQHLDRLLHQLDRSLYVRQMRFKHLPTFRGRDATWHNELWSWRETGRLSQLDLAFSRVQAADMPQVGLARWHPGYVQQVLHKHSLELKSWLNQGAVIYLCGSRMGMAKDVELRLHALLGEDGFKRLLEQERLKCDLY